VVRRKNPAVIVLIVSLVAASLLATGRTPAFAIEPTWFDLPAADSFPQGIAAGPDGATWVASRAASQIVRMSGEGVLSSFDLESGVDPFSIVQGPDGAMWFTENNGSRIGRLTPSGELSEFLVRDRSLPTGIAVGADGAIWFSQRGISSIGRITMGGEYTEWHTLTGRAAPLGIAAGSDGALWFTLPAVNAIGRISTDGAMTEFPLPSPTSNPQWITAGPDGALWFTERGVDAIGRITVDGQVTEFPVPTAAAGLSGITTGPDGAIWFTESAADAIGRIGMGGRILEIPLGEGVSPTGIATGADGQIWFSAPGVNRVGRLSPAVAVDVTPPVVTIVSPPEGSVLLEGEGMIADYFCTDEPGGSGLSSCEGPVPDGAVIGTPLGSHTFTVTASDVEGNVGSASHGYVVFQDIRGPITNQAVFAPGRVIPIILELGSRPAGGQVFASGYPLVRAVDCETGAPTGPDEPASVKANLSGNGRLMLLTDGGWGGSCRSLVVRLAYDGWSSADAVFKLHFS
jgi:virginiamycin B lyase